jgi:hypothetical protein
MGFSEVKFLPHIGSPPPLPFPTSHKPSLVHSSIMAGGGPLFLILYSILVLDESWLMWPIWECTNFLLKG